MNEIRKLLSDVPSYDAGIINDFGGGNTEWWMDYLRAEVGRANEHWQSIVDEALALLPPEGETRGDVPPTTRALLDQIKSTASKDSAGQVLLRKCGWELLMRLALQGCLDSSKPPAPSSEKALREALLRIDQMGTHKTVSARTFDGEVIPSKMVKTRWAQIANEALASSPAPEAPKERKGCTTCVHGSLPWDKGPCEKCDEASDWPNWKSKSERNATT